MLALTISVVIITTIIITITFINFITITTIITFRIVIMLWPKVIWVDLNPGMVTSEAALKHPSLVWVPIQVAQAGDSGQWRVVGVRAASRAHPERCREGHLTDR